MRSPTKRFIIEMANALRLAEHQNVAEHMAAGMLWAMYPEWFDKSYTPSHKATIGPHNDPAAGREKDGR